MRTAARLTTTWNQIGRRSARSPSFHLNAFPSITVATVSRCPRYHSAVALDDIKNFLPIDRAGGDARIGTAGQPTEDELREVGRDGYRAVVNLGLLNPEYC